MKKIINEIIENSPELEKDKDKLEKVVKTLGEISPNIQASSEFRKSLKTRLNGIISIKQNKKSNFALFAVPIFSLLFVATGFMYYYDDINFFGDSNKLPVMEINQETESIDQNLEIKLQNQESSTTEEKSLGLENPSNEPVVQNQNNLTDNQGKTTNKSKENTTNQSKENTTNQKIPDKNQEKLQENVDEIFDSSIEEISTSDNQVNENSAFDNQIDSNDIEDNSLIEIFESLGLNIDEETQNIEPFSVGAESMSDTSMMQRKITVELTFEEYCTGEGGILSGTGTELKCITNNKQCLSSDYLNQTCEFKEIK